MAWLSKTTQTDPQVEPLLDLYWLGYLLTGNREHSVQAVVDTLDVSDAANPFFAKWITTWSRKIFIAKVLDECRALTERSGVADDPGSAEGKALLERVLLAIDPFPRRALILRVFERLPLGDVALLLNAAPEAVEDAKNTALAELALRIDHRMVTVWAPPRHDSKPGVSLF